MYLILQHSIAKNHPKSSKIAERNIPLPVMQTYNQQIKNEAREKLIMHALQSLTNERKESFLVSKEHFTKITDHFNSLLFRYIGNKNLEFINEYNWLFYGGKNSWFEFYDNISKAKKASELKVLYWVRL